MQNPIYDYNAKDRELICKRSSAAVKEDYVNGFSDLVPFEKNTRKVLATSVGEPFLAAISSPICNETYNCVDTYNDRLLVWTSTELFHTTDAISFTSIINTATVNTPVGNTMADFRTALVAMDASPSIEYGVLQIDSNTAIVTIGGRVVPYSEGTDIGKIYRTTDNYATFVEVLSTDVGAFFLGEQFNNGQYLLATAYHTGDSGGNNKSPLAHTVWASFDYGVNWVIIFQETVNPIGDIAHTHFARFKDNDTVYVSFGDGDKSSLKKLTRPVAWDGISEWTMATNQLTHMTTSEFIIEGDLIYLPSEINTFKSFSILIYDTANETFSSSLHTVKLSDAGGTAYDFGHGYTGSNTIVKHGSKFYSGFHHFNETAITGGLFTSSDGVNWKCVYRGEKGVRRVFGSFRNSIVANVVVDGNTRLALFPDYSSVALDAIIVEKASENMISEYEAASNDNWSHSPSLTRTTLSTGQLYPEENMGKLQSLGSQNGFLSGTFSVDAAGAGANPDRVIMPLVGEYVNISYDLRATGLDDIDYINLKYLEIDINAINAAGNGTTHRRTFPFITEWHRIEQTMKVASVNLGADSFYFKFYNITGETPLFLEDAELYIQNFQMTYDVERYDSRTYTPKTMTKANDYSSAPLGNLGTSWSVTFDWFPLNGNLAFPTSVGNEKLHIATIIGADSDYIELYWDREAYDGAGGGQSFKITDGTNTVSLDAELSEAMQFLHHDNIKIGITSNGTTTTLYLFNPENPQIHGSVILSNSGSSVLSVPTQILLGTNNDETEIGAGAFANIRGFDSVLTAAEVLESFNKLSQTTEITGRHIGSRHG